MTVGERTADENRADRSADSWLSPELGGICLALVVIHLGLLTANSIIGLLVSIPLLVVLPGYILVSVLFPRAGPGAGQSGDQQPSDRQSSTYTRRFERVTLVERLGLSVGLSLALIPLFAGLLTVVPGQPFGGAIRWLLTVFVLLGAVLAAVRRRALPPEERFSLLDESGLRSGLSGLLGGQTRTERVVNVALIVSILVAASMAGYALAVPQNGEQFTDLHVMSETSDGDLLLGDFPETLTVGESFEFVVGIDNHEGERRQYTTVIVGQRITTDNGETRVLDSTEVARFTINLADGERTTQPQTITPESAGEVRYVISLYEESPPAVADPDDAYRSVYVPVTVVDADDQSDSSADEADENGADAPDETDDEPPIEAEDDATDEPDESDVDTDEADDTGGINGEDATDDDVVDADDDVEDTDTEEDDADDDESSTGDDDDAEDADDDDAEDADDDEDTDTDGDDDAEDNSADDDGEDVDDDADDDNDTDDENTGDEDDTTDDDNGDAEDAEIAEDDADNDPDDVDDDGDDDTEEDDAEDADDDTEEDDTSEE